MHAQTCRTGGQRGLTQRRSLEPKAEGRQRGRQGQGSLEEGLDLKGSLQVCEAEGLGDGRRREANSR